MRASLSVMAHLFVGLGFCASVALCAASLPINMPLSLLSRLLTFYKFSQALLGAPFASLLSLPNHAANSSGIGRRYRSLEFRLVCSLVFRAFEKPQFRNRYGECFIILNLSQFATGSLISVSENCLQNIQTILFVHFAFFDCVCDMAAVEFVFIFHHLPRRTASSASPSA